MQTVHNPGTHPMGWRKMKKIAKESMLQKNYSLSDVRKELMKLRSEGRKSV